MNKKNIELGALNYKSEILDRAINEHLGKLLAAQATELVCEDNLLHFQHGSQWASHVQQPRDIEEASEFKSISIETEYSVSRIRNLDYELLPEFFSKLTTQSREQLHGDFIREIKSSNCPVIDATDTSDPIEIFLRGLEASDWSMGSDGKVERPQFIVSPEMAQKLQDQAGEDPDGKIESRVKEIAKQKEQAAEERERARLKRFD